MPDRADMGHRSLITLQSVLPTKSAGQVSLALSVQLIKYLEVERGRSPNSTSDKQNLSQPHLLQRQKPQITTVKSSDKRFCSVWSLTGSYLDPCAKVCHTLTDVACIGVWCVGEPCVPVLAPLKNKPLHWLQSSPCKAKPIPNQAGRSSCSNSKLHSWLHVLDRFA